MTIPGHMIHDDGSQPSQDGATNDAVLASLVQTEAQYREMRASWERQAAEFQATLERQSAENNSALARKSSELQQAQQALTVAQASVQQLYSTLHNSQRQIEEEQQKAEQQREQTLRQMDRANKLAAILKDIHRSVFSGDLYTMILRTCLTLTGGTRGLYVTMRGEQRVVRVRAAVKVDGYPKTPPSEYIKALCAKVVDDNQTLVVS